MKGDTVAVQWSVISVVNRGKTKIFTCGLRIGVRHKQKGKLMIAWPHAYTM